MGDDLEPLAPEKAVQMYLDANPYGSEVQTLKGQKYRLAAFVQWCEENDVESLSELGGRDLFEYRIWRSEGHGEGRNPIKKVTLRGQLATLRRFLQFAGDIDAVPADLFDKVELPNVTGDEDVSDSFLEPERIPGILDYLSTYHYASRDHVVVLLLWHTGCRLGGLRTLDLGDLDLDGEETEFEGPAIHFVHRPGTDTPLKNKDNGGTRWNRVSDYVASVISDYIDGPRSNVIDEYGREPLITTTQGRASRTTIRGTLYRVTRPCWLNKPCPHDRDPEDCEATHMDFASKCPSSRSPHDVRSGRVTDYRTDDVPRRVVKDQLNASEDILDKHYDRRSERQKAEQRADHLPDL